MNRCSSGTTPPGNSDETRLLPDSFGRIELTHETPASAANTPGAWTTTRSRRARIYMLPAGLPFRVGQGWPLRRALHRTIATAGSGLQAEFPRRPDHPVPRLHRPV